MNTPKHTPGPWVYTDIDEQVSDQYGEVVCRIYCNEDGYNSANCHLIAAAPQMLEALKAIINAVPVGVHGQTIDTVLEMVRETIKSATT